MSKPMSPINPKHKRVVPGGISFARWLRPQLDRLGWSPVVAARHFAVSPEITRSYMHGFNVPTAVTLARIEAAVGETYRPSGLVEAVVSIPVQGTAQASGEDDIVITLRLSRAKLLALAKKS